MRVLFLLLGLNLFFPAISQETQTPPPAILSADDVDRFITTLKPMSEELEALGIEADNGANEWVTADKAVAILEKYGWTSETWLEKYSKITLGFAYHAMMKVVNEMPAEQKDAADQMRAMYETQYKAMIHPDDLKLVGDQFDRLMELGLDEK